MKAIKTIILSIALTILFIIICSYIIRLCYHKEKLNIYILDKTVKDFSYVHHRSLFWILNNAFIVKNTGKNYSYKNDYYGFFPLRPYSDRHYKIKHITLEQIDSISNVYDALYYCDTYGVYFSEWFRGFRSGNENSVIEGGLNQNDYYLLKLMKERNKLVILEYNTLGSPTSDLVRFKTGVLLGVQPTGWTGKYINDLDSSNHAELPQKIINNYLYQNNGQWPFKGCGIILVNNSNVIVLQKGLHLIDEKPVIYSSEESQKKYHIPYKTSYFNWFEIVNCSDTNEIIANFRLDVTNSGDSILHANNLTSNFPAIISNHNNGINMFYFTGDFANNKVPCSFAKLKNSHKLLALLTSDERKLFFFKFYFPLMENILLNYSKIKESKKI